MADPGTTAIDYDHHLNYHSVTGAAAALPYLFEHRMPESLLDVGCGAGTWLRAALDLGVKEVAGIEGVPIPKEELLIPAGCIQVQDLSRPWNLGRRFDLVLCLEVAEHLEEKFAPLLIRSLTEHTDWILFSAAVPLQSGQNHVNCQWPEFWQQLFNQNGFVCEDTLREVIWNDERIEPWYRQNLFTARRDATSTGTEPRIRGMIHPAILATIVKESVEQTESALLEQITSGKMPRSWYAKTAASVVKGKLRRSRKTP